MGEGEHRNCRRRRANVKCKGMEKNQTAEERQGAVRDGKREQQQWKEIRA